MRDAGAFARGFLSTQGLKSSLLDPEAILTVNEAFWTRGLEMRAVPTGFSEQISR